ncbi:methionine aminotransferase [soil metagenome]
MDRYAAQRIQRFGTSVFSEMSRLSAIHQAVNLGQGFPDFPGPDFVKEAAKRAIDANLNQYAPSHGLPRLRNAIAATFERATGRAIDVDSEITVTSGATEAVYDAVQAFLNPGDEIVIFEPFYDSYVASAEFAGAVPTYVTLRAPDWSIDLDELRAAFTDRTRVLMLNTPHNPTGKVFSREELQAIADLCIEHDVIVLSDEVYDRILFDGVEHVSIATLPGMWERTLTINSTGKTFSMTGWKIGYAIGPASLNAALRTVHQFVTFASQTPFQDAMAEALELAATNGYYDQLAREYTDRRRQMNDALVDAGFTVLPSAGTYFLTIDGSRFGFATDVEFVHWLITEAGVTSVPPSAFYADASRAPLLARFCFAKQHATIAEAATRLQAAAPKLGQLLS